MQHPSVDAPVTVGLALAAGMVSQALGRHLRVPGIVLLLAAGWLLGPDVTGLIRPESLGAGLQLIVGFAVSIILFEGGLNLGLKRLRRQARVIQLLITIGAAITAVGGAAAAHWIMGWEWRIAIPFGALVVVTGPTVVTPLLRRIKVTHSVETVLEAEAVLIDAIGAVLAVVCVQVVLEPAHTSLAEGALSVLQRLGFGILCGLVGGAVIALLLRTPRLVPDGLENVFTLSLVVALFQVSNAWMEESGIMTVTVAGMVVGNTATRVRRELLEFKEQLTVMLIGLLFVLLAADVRVESVVSLGWPGVATVAALMLVVRPLDVAVSTHGSELNLREKLFLSWLAPRGVVAAAVASLFAQMFNAAGISGGEELRALVFAVIAGTVVVQGLTGGLVARALGLRRPSDRGFAILGANPLGRTIGRLLRDAGEDVLFLESNPQFSHAAEEDGFRVVYGNAIEHRTLQRARLAERAACVAVTTNEEVNLLFARLAGEEFDMKRIYVAARRDSGSVTPDLVHGVDARVLFGAPRDLDLWMVRLRRGTAPIGFWRLEEPVSDVVEWPGILLLPLVWRRGSSCSAVSTRHRWKREDQVALAVFSEKREEAHEWLARNGWRETEPESAQEGREPAGRQIS